MAHELLDEHCTRVLAREHFLLGACQTEVEALHLGLADGRWYRKQIMPDGTERITKGSLPFEPSDCKECKEKMK